MKRVLFVFSIFNFYREMAPVAEHYAEKGWQVHALLGWSGSTAREAAAFCRAAGWVVHEVPDRFKYHGLDEFSAAASDNPAENEAQDQLSLLTKYSCRIKRALPFFARRSFFFVDLGKMFLKYLSLNSWTRNFLAAVAPALVFAGPFQSVGRFDNSIARLCKMGKIPYCSLSVSVYVGERFAIAGRYNNVKNGMLSPNFVVDHNFANKIVAKFFPHWVRQMKELRLFPFPPMELVAAQALGLLETSPWQKPAECFDLVFVEAELSREMLEKSHYDQTKIVLAGKPLLDQVYKSLNNKKYVHALYRDLGLSPHEPFILVNIEPSAEHHYSSWEDHWERFFAVMNCLAAVHRSVIISLHPLCDPKAYRFVEEKYGFKISEKYKIVELYPYCRLVVSFPCSTNIFSVHFRKPLLIYDFLGMTREGYENFEYFRIPRAVYAYDATELGLRLAEFNQSDIFDLRVEERVDVLPGACDIIYEKVSQKFGLY